MPLHRVSEDCRCRFKEYVMICHRAKDLDDALMLVESHPDYMVLCGSTDAAAGLKKKSVSGIIDIHTLDELRYIKTVSDEMQIGALATITLPIFWRVARYGQTFLSLPPHRKFSLHIRSETWPRSEATLPTLHPQRILPPYCLRSVRPSGLVHAGEKER